jgi:hypothetical protein
VEDGMGDERSDQIRIDAGMLDVRTSIVQNYKKLNQSKNEDYLVLLSSPANTAVSVADADP